MQNYKEINAQDYVSASRTTINDNIKTLMSNNSGSEFPTSNLFEGMKCYRTDLKKTYTLKEVENQTWEEDSKAEALADAITIAITGGATGMPTVFDGSSNISILVTSLDATKLTGTAPISITGNAATASSVAWGGVTGKSNATQSVAGLMSAADKKKLDGIDAEANKYSLPTASSSTLGGVKIGSNINISSGTISVSGMTAATSSAAGKTGLVPAPAAGKQGQFLRGDGTWQTPTNTTYSDFVKSGSTAAHGLVPKPSTTAGTTHYLREDGTWAVPPNTTYSTGTASTSGITKLYTGVGDNTDGTMTQKAIKAIVGTVTPIGAIIAYASNGTLPDGYLLCDGSAVSRTTYAGLFRVIGTTYGAGDGSNTFNLPDYNTAKRFAQGDTVAGQTKSAGLPNIEGQAGYWLQNEGMATGALTAADGRTRVICNTTLQSNNTFSAVKFNASWSNPIYGASDTVQPNALTCRYIIKYK